jgi:hypothetical protein
MKRILIIFALFILSTKSAHAALIDINHSGDITLNVLAATTDGLTVKKVANARFNPNDSKITLNSENGKLALDLESSSGNRSLDVTDLDQNIVEIEKYISPQTITIKADKDKFQIIQSNAVALTSFPIEVNTADKQILVKSSSGYQYLKTLPLDVINTLNLLEIIDDTTSLELAQNQEGELVYISSGDKIINVLGIYDYKVPVTANISVSTGKIEKIEGPLWYKIFGFLLV